MWNYTWNTTLPNPQSFYFNDIIVKKKKYNSIFSKLNTCLSSYHIDKLKQKEIHYITIQKDITGFKKLYTYKINQTNYSITLILKINAVKLVILVTLVYSKLK